MTDDIQELLKELQQNYLASIPEKILAIQTLWHSGELKLLKTDFHKLKGTGRTYGLPEITQIGEAMEQIVANGNPLLINECVPLSIDLMREISEVRARGDVPHIEDGAKFQRLIAVLTAEHSSDSKGKKTG